jgi:amidohydrolase
MLNIAKRVEDIYNTLHVMPETGFSEYRTSEFLENALQKAGYQVCTGVGRTGVVGMIQSGKPGPTVALRADMDALIHTVKGQEVCIHSCGHDSHCAMVLTSAEVLAAQGVKAGTLKILFQPAEEILKGALAMIEAGAADGIDILFGIHLRPIQEARTGQATPALYHGASYIMEAVVTGLAAHGARPHLGINAVDAAIAAVQAVNAIHLNPVVPWSVKTTRLHAGGSMLNIIPDRAELAFDLRAQSNESAEELIEKVKQAVVSGAATVGAKAEVTVKGGVPGAEYDAALIEIARQAITAVLGPVGLLNPIVTPGGEDYHYFAKKVPGLRSAYIGLGCDAEPGLHHPDMHFDLAALPKGVAILLKAVELSLV